MQYWEKFVYILFLPPYFIYQQFKVIVQQDNHFPTDCIGHRAKRSREETGNEQRSGKTSRVFFLFTKLHFASLEIVSYRCHRNWKKDFYE